MALRSVMRADAGAGPAFERQFAHGLRVCPRASSSALVVTGTRVPAPPRERVGLSALRTWPGSASRWSSGPALPSPSSRASASSSSIGKGAPSSSRCGGGTGGPCGSAGRACAVVSGHCRSRQTVASRTWSSALGGGLHAFSQGGDKFDGRYARQKRVRSGLGRNEARETRNLDRRASVCLRNDENTLCWILGANQWIFRLWVKPDSTGEFAVIDPLSQHELVLVFDIRVDEMKEHPALDAIVGFFWIIGRAVRQPATDQPMGIVAAAGQPLALDWLTSWIDSAYVCADGTVDPLRISRAIGIYIPEIVQLFRRYSSRRAISIR